MADKMNILIMGGTGAMGTHLSQLLSSRYQVFITTRSARHCDTENIHYLHGNALDLNFLRPVLQQGWDVIVDFMRYSSHEFAERIELLLDATRQYVFTSSARVYANTEGLLTEESLRLLDVSTDREYLATDEYSLAKARAEDMLQHSGRTNWTIVRPYITYGDQRLQLATLEKESWLYRALHGRTIVMADDIAQRTTTLTWGGDVARAISALIGRDDVLGQTYHIATSESLRWQEVLDCYTQVIERETGHRPKTLQCTLKQYTSCHPAKYQILYDRMFDRRFDNRKIGHWIDTSAFEPSIKGLDRCLSAFLEKPRFGPISWRAEAMQDRLTREQTPLAEIPSMKQKAVYFTFRYLLSDTAANRILRLVHKLRHRK